MSTYRQNWENFFNQIVKDSAASPTKAKFYQRLGIDPGDWPECEARELMNRLAARRSGVTEAMQRAGVGAKAQALSGFQMPETSIATKALYDEICFDIKARQLAEQVLRDTSRSEDLIRNFLNRKKSKVKKYRLEDAVNRTILDIMEKGKKGEALRSIENWPKLSAMVGGFNSGRISIITAGTGVGKTNFALNLALDAIKTHPTLMFNMEMSIEDVTGRIIRKEANIKPNMYFAGELGTPELNPWLIRIDQQKPFFITDGSALTLEEIIAEIHQTNDEENLGYVFVDYDQKIKTSLRGEEWQTLLRAVEELEQCAKDTDTHIFILAQGNDEGDPKASKRSKQPASTVLQFFAHDTDYYVRAVKNRHGVFNATLRVNYQPDISKVRELELGEPRRSLL